MGSGRVSFAPGGSRVNKSNAQSTAWNLETPAMGV